MQSIQDRLKNAPDSELTEVFKDLVDALDEQKNKDIIDSLEYVRVRIQQVRDVASIDVKKYTILTECIAILYRIKEKLR